MDNPMWSDSRKLDRLIDVDELAESLGVKKQTLYRWRLDGRGPRAIRVGKFLRYRLSDVIAWQESQLDPKVA